MWHRMFEWWKATFRRDIQVTTQPCISNATESRREIYWGGLFAFPAAHLTQDQLFLLLRLSSLGTSATNWHIVTAPDDRWWMWSSRWNENWQGKPKYSENTCPSATLSTTNPTWPDLGSNQRLIAWAMAQPQVNYKNLTWRQSTSLLRIFLNAKSSERLFGTKSVRSVQHSLQIWRSAYIRDRPIH
jgi:hypothetical protein